MVADNPVRYRDDKALQEYMKQWRRWYRTDIDPKYEGELPEPPEE